MVVLVQLLLSVSLALILSALTVHFRDIKDILARYANETSRTARHRAGGRGKK